MFYIINYGPVYSLKAGGKKRNYKKGQSESWGIKAGERFKSDYLDLAGFNSFFLHWVTFYKSLLEIEYHKKCFAFSLK